MLAKFPLSRFGGWPEPFPQVRLPGEPERSVTFGRFSLSGVEPTTIRLSEEFQPSRSAKSEHGAALGALLLTGGLLILIAILARLFFLGGIRRRAEGRPLPLAAVQPPLPFLEAAPSTVLPGETTQPGKILAVETAPEVMPAPVTMAETIADQQDVVRGIIARIEAREGRLFRECETLPEQVRISLFQSMLESNFEGKLDHTSVSIAREFLREHLFSSETKRTLEELSHEQLDQLVRSLLPQSVHEIDPEIFDTNDSSRYEQACAVYLNACGWSAEAIGRVNDRGVDIIATKEQTTVIVQCKNYSTPVGNSAVQEIVAAKALFDADLAVVVAPNGFTDGARELADANGVLLIHHSALNCLPCVSRE